MTLRYAMIAAMFALCAGSVQAVTFTVTEEADLPDLIPGNGFCNVFPQAGAGPCTLRAAIIEANALAGPDQINLSAGAMYTLDLPGAGEDDAHTGDLDINDDLTLLFFASGVRPVVDAHGLERAFEINAGNVSMIGFDITGGEATVPSNQTGGAVAINFDAGSVQLSLLRLYGNVANFGGGLYNDGPNTRLSASELYANEAADDFTDSGGSAIRNRGGLTVDHSSMFGNSGVGSFGATTVSNAPPNVGAASLTLIDSTIASNLGPGLSSYDDASLFVRNSTIADNRPGYRRLRCRRYVPDAQQRGRAERRSGLPDLGQRQCQSRPLQHGFGRHL